MVKRQKKDIQMGEAAATSVRDSGEPLFSQDMRRICSPIGDAKVAKAVGEASGNGQQEERRHGAGRGGTARGAPRARVGREEASEVRYWFASPQHLSPDVSLHIKA